MMEKKRWSWKRKSSEKSSGSSEGSGSVSSHSERSSDEQEASTESPNGSNQSPVVTSKAEAGSEDVDRSLSMDALASEVASKARPATDKISEDSLEDDGNDSKDNFRNVKEDDVNDGLKKLSEKLSAALVNVSAKEDLVKQHAKVAEEAIAGWEKAENEAAVLKKQLEAAVLKNSALEDRVTHLDGALKECVRQLRQTREEQEQNMHDAVVEKTHDLESAKLKLEKQLLELQSKLDASNAKSPATVDHDLCQKVDHLEKENLNLKHDLIAQLEELKIRTVERDLSTKAAETASKQHLESIKKVAKLEAECRRLKSMSHKTSSVNDHKSITSASICVESLSDSQSDSGERLNAVENIDFHKMNGLESNKSEPSCSDSWASALIAELDQFKNEKCRQPSSSSAKIDLMDDFLEMERLASLSETKNESSCQEPVAANQHLYEESSLRAELENMNQQMSELTGKLEKAEAEKAELAIALMKSEDCIEASQLQLREAEMKLEEMQREIEAAYKSKEMIDNQLMSMEEEAQKIFAKVYSLEVDIDGERDTFVEIALKCKELEEELERKKQEENLRCAVSSYTEKKIKQEDLALAAGKLAECQKTIASLGNQLKSLATLEDFLIDTASIPEFSASPSLVARAGGETWKLHSNDTFSPKRETSSSKGAEGSSSPSLNKNEGSPPSSLSTSSASLPSVSSERSRNGFAKFFSRTKSGIRLEI
ncbi:filament-like plant protein isoform X2 [Neltuma alba]|uniref:filament-like plant protein isoform X2 n=1 Tax=Neltuma alba TaxID=207710 RepID=UPI0010A507A7|nr:filament-like plant protein isoform X2 [Prosopis alba]